MKVFLQEKNIMRGKKNDFSMSFYLKRERVLFLEYVHDTNVAMRWMSEKKKSWDYAIVYNRRTREKIQVLENYLH